MQLLELRTYKYKGETRTTTCMTASMCKKLMGIDSIVISNQQMWLNTTAVEDLLQARYHDLGLTRRLHRRCNRRVGMGDNGFQDEAGATELHKVFLAYSFDVQDAIETGEVVVVV